MKICLYSTIPFRGENVRRHRHPWSALKDSIKRTRDRARWLLTSDRTFDVSAWSMYVDDNRGDMAIRRAVQELFRRVFGRDVQFAEYGWGTLDRRAVKEVNTDCDLFVISGGGYLFIEDDGSLGNRRLTADIEYLGGISCPKVAYGVGLNQVLSFDSALAQEFNIDAAKLVRRWLGYLDLVAVRDQATHDVLQKIDRRSMSVIGDPALFLGSASTSQFTEGNVGINFAVHGPLAQELFSKHFYQYCSMLKELRNNGFRLTYFQHSEVDSVAVRMFKSAGISLSVVDVPPQDLPSAYSRMEFTVCQMLHSAILAANVDVPSINIAYDRKNFAFYELFGMQDYCIHHDKFSLEWLRNCIERVRLNRAIISASLAHRKHELFERQTNFLDMIKKTVRRA